MSDDLVEYNMLGPNVNFISFSVLRMHIGSVMTEQVIQVCHVFKTCTLESLNGYSLYSLAVWILPVFTSLLLIEEYYKEPQ